MACYSLSPSRTPLFVGMSQILTVCAAWVGVADTIIVVVFLAYPGAITNSKIVLPIILSLTVYAIGAWTFVYPQYSLRLLIRRAKRQTLLQIGAEIEKTFRNLPQLQNQDFDRLKNLQALYETVDESPNSVLDLGKLRIVSFATIAPTLATIVGAIPWPQVLQRFGLHFP